MRAELRSAIGTPWDEMEPLRIGQGPPGFGTPEAFVTIEDQGKPRLRVDVYETTGPFQALQVWHKAVVLGWGEHLYIIRPEEEQVTTIQLDGYFGHLYLANEYLLVSSAERLVRLQPDASVAWTTEPLGIDGVVVDGVSGQTIAGSGEWDPPGGWRPFRISVETGQPV